MPTPRLRPARAAGLLLHPTSLPGPYGIGDLGDHARAWVDTLAWAKQSWWQVLPLGPTGFGDSPYQAFSAFAGNPNLLSPSALLADNLLLKSDLDNVQFPAHRVEFGPVIKFKNGLVARAWERYGSGAAPQLRGEFEAFRARQKAWLDDYTLFMALKDTLGMGWLEWPRDLTRREPAALAGARRELADAVGRHEFAQFLFFRQLAELRRYAAGRGVRLIGDVPIFVSSDSADVWANPELFALDKDRRPRLVAGVPPDYFSRTGQLWGNPLYDWDTLRRTKFAWWVARLRATLGQVDVVRLDHFRGFEACWEVPADAPTAETGRWVKVPGAELFATLRQELGGLPLIAEDLGLITPEVEALRTQFDLPGMRVLQFAFNNDPEDRFLPHTYDFNTVVYTGTHDNDTTQGWYATLPEWQRDFLRRFLARDGGDVSWDLLRLAWSSPADLALAPLQDVLNLGGEARMNLPGRADGNWSWRFTAEMLHHGLLDRLRLMTELYARAPVAKA